MTTRITLAGLAALAGLTLTSACANSDGNDAPAEPTVISSASGSAAPSVTTRPGESNDPSAPAPSAAPSSAASSTAALASAGTVDINSASTAQIAAALQAAGVPDAQRYAEQATRLRPFSGAADLNRLRQELTAAGADPATLARILSVLRA